MLFSTQLFANKNILVTGGGSGIGLAIARQFLECGATVFIASRKPERLQNALQTLQKHGTCYAHVLDIRQPEAIEHTIAYIKEKTGNLDVLINNAGGQFPAPAEMISNNGWNAVINTNLNGTFYMCKEIANAFFIPQKQGVILNIIANIYKGFPGMAHTAAARAGVDSLTKTLAIEWATHKIRINALAPGIIQSSGLDNYPPEMLTDIASKVPLKRLGSTDEVAYSALFLCSSMANFITGETLYIDGGQRLWGDMWEIPN